jgi:hypothetical protein
MLDPEHLLEDIERMIEEERTSALRGDPEQEASHWLDRLAEADGERRGFLRLAARGSITDAELDEALAELDDLRETAERELRAIEGRKDARRQLERDWDALKEHYAKMAPEVLDALTPEERHQLYKILRLRVTADADRKLTVEGMFGDVSVQDESSTCVIVPLCTESRLRFSAKRRVHAGSCMPASENASTRDCLKSPDRYRTGSRLGTRTTQTSPRASVLRY